MTFPKETTDIRTIILRLVKACLVKQCYTMKELKLEMLEVKSFRERKKPNGLKHSKNRAIINGLSLSDGPVSSGLENVRI